MTLEVHLGDVVALRAPDGTLRRYMVTTLTDHRRTPPVTYELSDHLEGSPSYDGLLNERTTIVLTVGGEGEGSKSND